MFYLLKIEQKPGEKKWIFVPRLPDIKVDLKVLHQEYDSYNEALQALDKELSGED